MFIWDGYLKMSKFLKRRNLCKVILERSNSISKFLEGGNYWIVISLKWLKYRIFLLSWKNILMCDYGGLVVRFRYLDYDLGNKYGVRFY